MSPKTPQHYKDDTWDYAVVPKPDRLDAQLNPKPIQQYARELGELAQSWGNEGWEAIAGADRECLMFKRPRRASNRNAA